MKTDKINSELIETIKSRIPGSALDTLSKILSLSKEAIYRRLRGEVLFSYSEAVLIAQSLHFSLDEIGLGTTDYALYNTNIPTFASSEKAYIDIINYWTNHISHFLNKEFTHFYVMTSGLPLSLLSSSPNLLKFNYYISLYEKGNIDHTHGGYADTNLSPHLLQVMSDITALFQCINSTYILSENPFAYYLKQIRYLQQLELIDEKDIKEIKKELYSIVDDLKAITASAKYSTGYSVNYYLTEVSIDASFGMFEDEPYSLVFIKMFGMNYRLSGNMEVIKIHKTSFDNMKHFATLISKSGSAKRKSFFEKQISIIDEI